MIRVWGRSAGIGAREKGSGGIGDLEEERKREVEFRVRVLVAEEGRVAMGGRICRVRV